MDEKTLERWNDTGHEDFVDALCTVHSLGEATQDYLTLCDTWSLYSAHGAPIDDEGRIYFGVIFAAEAVTRAELAAFMWANRPLVRAHGAAERERVASSVELVVGEQLTRAQAVAVFGSKVVAHGGGWATFRGRDVYGLQGRNGFTVVKVGVFHG